MSPLPPSPLAENAGLVFTGEKLWAPALITDRQASSLEQSRNPTGRPNSDVLRRCVGFESGRPHEYWQIDFPLHSNAQEVALYQQPCQQLRAQLTDFAGQWWLNPHAKPALRTSVARLERYLAAPLAAKTLSWDWIDSNLLPDDSLLVVARDDDFSHGILTSRIFQAWLEKYSPRLTPAEVVSSFPFPWSPATLLSSLTRIQEDHRMAVTRAARGTDLDQLNSAVTAAYGWSADSSDEELLAQLQQLHQQRIP